ncbi:hypothetical protein NVP1032O_55 [Vibrio phage 1.032.O._10N.261.54.F5]|nr:hypothetical protein NVP1032O_55 [Vibrio phage 1.032.O._10N.261.54.F5]
MSRVALVGGSRIGSALAMLAANSVFQDSYDFEYRGGDMLLRNKKDVTRISPLGRKVWYTVDSPEVKRMSKPYDK